MLIVRRSSSAGGAYRDRHGRWVRDAMDAGVSQGVRHDADGEIVWSRSPDAGIEPAGGDLQAAVANKPGTPGRSRISRNTIAQGRPGRSG